MAISIPKRPLVPQRTVVSKPAPRSAPQAPPSAMGSFGSALGTVAIAIGVGVLGAYMLDMHAHTCDACGNRWRHLGAFNVGDSASHTCKSCGVVQWWKDGVPHVFRSSLQPVSPATIAARLQESRGVRPLGLPSLAPALPASRSATTPAFDPTQKALATKENNS